jgi:hypothetical protein
MEKYLGYTQEDCQTDYAHYYNEEIQALPVLVQNALAQSPFSAGSIPAFAEIRTMQNVGYSDVETGFTLEADGAAHVAVLTSMPRVTPQMWAWWFGWHGSKANRYKLWHPKAHVDARWEDGKDDIAYIGRHSVIEEYIGKNLEKAVIQFQQPTDLGFSPDVVQNSHEAVYICARIGHATLPIDFGWLLHHVRVVEGGSEMRSRFWMGGRYLQVRKEGMFADIVSRPLRKLQTVSEQQARDILTHCAEEMNHLAAFLPEIYSQLNQ